MMLARDQGWGCGPVEAQPCLHAPIGLRPVSSAVALPIVSRPLFPGALEPGWRRLKFRQAPGLFPEHGLRVRGFRPAVEIGGEVPALEAEPLLWRGAGSANGHRLVGGGKNAPACGGEMDVEHGEDILTRENLACLHRVPDCIKRLVTAVRDRGEPGPFAFGQKLRLPVGPGKIQAARGVFRIGPAKSEIEQIPEGAPVFRRLSLSRWGIRVMTEGASIDMHRAGMRHVDLEAPGVGVGRDIGHRSRVSGDTGPECFDEKGQGEIDLPTPTRVSRIEGDHVDVAFFEGKEAESILALEGQGGDLASQDLGPAEEDFRNRCAIHANPGPADHLHDPRAVHIHGQRPVVVGSGLTSAPVVVMMVGEADQHQDASP